MTHMPSLSTLALVATLSAPMSAHALDAQIVRYGVTTLGQVGNTQYMVTEPWDGSPCFFTSIGGSTGLTENLRVWGTNERDWIGFATAATTLCGVTMYPLVQNGYSIEIYGMHENDSLSGGSNSRTWLYGNAGNDYLRIAPNGYGSGHDGNDWIYGRDRSSDTLIGLEGNDLLCQRPATICSKMEGGTGLDKHCGSARTLTGMEGIDCAACGY